MKRLFRKQTGVATMLTAVGIGMAVGLCTACGGRGGQEPAEQEAKACLEAGEALLAADSVQQGETLLRRAVRLAEDTGDWHTCYIACQRLAQSLSWSNTREALQLARKAVEVYELHPDDERNHIILLDFAGTYAAQLAYNTDDDTDAEAPDGQAAGGRPLDRYAEALDYTQRAYHLAVKQGMEDLTCQTLTSLANIYWAAGEYPQALDHARRAERSCLAADSTAGSDLLQGTLQVLARCYLSCDSLPQAEAAYRRMEAGDDIHAAYIIQSNLAKIAVRRRSAAEAEAAIDSTFERAEQLYFKALAQKDDYYQATLQQERENERLAYAAALQRRTYVGIIAALVLLLLAALLVLQQRVRMSRQRRAYEQARHEQEVVLHRQQTQLLQQEAESQRTRLLQATEVVSFLKNYILERNEVVQKLNKSADTRISLSTREWNDVEHILDVLDDNRFVRLRQRFPNLREEDMQLCILTRLQLSNRAIGNIYSLTVSAVQHRKLKLKKDGLGEPDPDVTLEQVLNRM